MYMKAVRVNGGAGPSETAQAAAAAPAPAPEGEVALKEEAAPEQTAAPRLKPAAAPKARQRGTAAAKRAAAAGSGSTGEVTLEAALPAAGVVVGEGAAVRGGDPAPGMEAGESVQGAEGAEDAAAALVGAAAVGAAGTAAGEAGSLTTATLPEPASEAVPGVQAESSCGGLEVKVEAGGALPAQASQRQAVRAKPEPRRGWRSSARVRHGAGDPGDSESAAIAAVAAMGGCACVGARACV